MVVAQETYKRSFKIKSKMKIPSKHLLAIAEWVIVSLKNKNLFVFINNELNILFIII